MAVATGRERRDDASLDELDALARSAGLVPAARRIFHRQRPDSATYLGSGAVETFGAELDAIDPAVVIFDHGISAVQQRNLERAWNRHVSDRTELIIDIFSQRAHSSEGKLQVELARLEHQASRLVRMWSHLERQRGGIGHRGGPGERQIELDRRMIDEKIRRLKERLHKVERQRATRRRSRTRGSLPLVSLIGYTNAGKSTLFNRISRAGAYAADQLFATLDPLTRRVRLAPQGNVDAAGRPGGVRADDVPETAGSASDEAAAPTPDSPESSQGPQSLQDHYQRPMLAPEILLSDTVGFVRELPHGLIAAFRATLEETADADLLLHVVDADASDREEQMAAVARVLAEIGAADVPQWLILNKIDRTGLEPGERLDPSGKIISYAVSALNGSGISDLRRALAIWASTFRESSRAPDAPSALPSRVADPADPQAASAPGGEPAAPSDGGPIALTQ